MYIGHVTNELRGDNPNRLMVIDGVEVEIARAAASLPAPCHYAINLGLAEAQRTSGPRRWLPVSDALAEELRPAAGETPRLLRADLAKFTMSQRFRGHDYDRLRDDSRDLVPKQQLVREQNPDDRRAIVFVDILHTAHFDNHEYTTHPCSQRGKLLSEFMHTCSFCAVATESVEQGQKRRHPVDQGECGNESPWPPKGVQVIGWGYGYQNRQIRVFLMEPGSSIYCRQSYPLALPHGGGIIIRWDGEKLTVERGSRVKVGMTDGPQVMERAGDLEEEVEPPDPDELEERYYRLFDR